VPCRTTADRYAYLSEKIGALGGVALTYEHPALPT
jgi:hypothetical protein